MYGWDADLAQFQLTSGPATASDLRLANAIFGTWTDGVHAGGRVQDCKDGELEREELHHGLIYEMR